MHKFIFLHGAFGTHHDLEKLATKFDSSQVINFDLPFHGTDYASFNYSTLKQALLKRLANESHYSIFGYSLGGYLALDLASEKKIHPEKIITYGTKFHWTSEIVEGIKKKMDLERLKSKAPQYVQELEEKHGPNFAAFINDSLALMLEVSNDPLTAKQFMQVNCPVTLIIGDKDSLVSVEETKKVASLFTKAEYIVVEGAHTPVPEQLYQYLF
jgi:pimeloyl-ACP methyl ester carboxylesterase